MGGITGDITTVGKQEPGFRLRNVRVAISKKTFHRFDANSNPFCLVNQEQANGYWAVNTTVIYLSIKGTLI